jgi:hypothetical protein
VPFTSSPHPGISGFQRNGVFNNRDLLRSLGQLQPGVFRERTIDIDFEASLVLVLEPLSFEMEIIPADGQARESVDAVLIGFGFRLNVLCFVGHCYCAPSNHGSRRIL